MKHTLKIEWDGAVSVATIINALEGAMGSDKWEVAPCLSNGSGVNPKICFTATSGVTIWVELIFGEVENPIQPTELKAAVEARIGELRNHVGAARAAADAAGEAASEDYMSDEKEAAYRAARAAFIKMVKDLCGWKAVLENLKKLEELK